MGEPHPRGTVTLQDVAERCGLSAMTVSKVMRGVGSISAATRDRVLKVAEEMNYRPHAGAQAMRRGRYGIVAWLIARREYRSDPDAVLGASDTLQAAGENLLVSLMPEPDTRPAEQQQAGRRFESVFAQLPADGLLLHYSLPPAQREAVRAAPLPAVWVNDRREADCVWARWEAAAAAAVERLVAAGHRRIAYCTRELRPEEALRWHHSPGDAEAGYRRAMADAGLEPTVCCLPHPQGERFAAAERVVRAWRAIDPPVTGVVCYWYFVLPALLQAIRRTDTAVPRDLSLITLADPVYERAGLPVSTMLLPTHELGRRAAEMMLTRLARPQESIEPAMVDFVYHDHGTIAPPAAPGR